MPGKYRGRCLPLNANWQINCFIQALLQVPLTLQALQRDLPVPHPRADRGGCRSSLGLQVLTPGLFFLVPCTQKERPWTLKDCILRRKRHRKYLSSPQTESNLHSVPWPPPFTRSTATLQEEEEQPHDLKARVCARRRTHCPYCPQSYSPIPSLLSEFVASWNRRIV